VVVQHIGDPHQSLPVLRGAGFMHHDY
jgi:hypothetical protein